MQKECGNGLKDIVFSKSCPMYQSTSGLLTTSKENQATRFGTLNLSQLYGTSGNREMLIILEMKCLNAKVSSCL